MSVRLRGGLQDLSSKDRKLIAQSVTLHAAWPSGTADGKELAGKAQTTASA